MSLYFRKKINLFLTSSQWFFETFFGHFQLIFYQNSSFFESLKKWHFSPTLMTFWAIIVTTHWVQQVFMLFLKIHDFHPYPSRRPSLIFFQYQHLLKMIHTHWWQSITVTNQPIISFGGGNSEIIFHNLPMNQSSSIVTYHDFWALGMPPKKIAVKETLVHSHLPPSPPSLNGTREMGT